MYPFEQSPCLKVEVEKCESSNVIKTNGNNVVELFRKCQLFGGKLIEMKQVNIIFLLHL